MGIVRMGPPKELVLLLQSEYNLSWFIETGTFLGETTAWAAGAFDHVVTVEGARELYDSTRQKLDDVPNIQFVHGDSRAQLPGIVKELDAAAIFWLDAHWCGDASYGEAYQCPLIEELSIIAQANHVCYILIDDARLFMSPPPHPNVADQWPTINEVIEALLQSDRSRYVVIFEDVIVCVPREARNSVMTFCQDANTIAWKRHGMELQSSTIYLYKRASRSTYRGLRLRASGAYRSVVRRISML